jgi:ketosteroid isomerase-like protein
MSQENVEIVRELIDRSNAGDVPGMLELVSPEIVGFPATDQPESGILRGPAEFATYLQSWHDAWGERTVAPREFIDRGDWVIVTLKLVVRGRASGIPVTADDAHLWRFRGGRAIEYRECGTKEKALEAAGLSEQAMSQVNVDLVWRHTGNVDIAETHRPVTAGGR